MWTMWIVTFGLAMPAREFETYRDWQLCHRLAEEIVSPIVKGAIASTVVICVPYNDSSRKTAPRAENTDNNTNNTNTGPKQRS